MNGALGPETMTLVGRIMACQRAKTRFGDPYLRLTLAAEGQVSTAYLWRTRAGPQRYPVGLEVIADVCYRPWKGMRVLEVLALAPARLDRRIRLAGGTAVLPEWLPRLAPVPRAVHRLWAQLGLLGTPVLQTFAQRVLHDPAIAVPFATLPASRAHHHARPGGLLTHSLECAIQVPWFEGLSRAEWEVARVAALYHDLGKIRSAGGGERPCAEAVLIPHDAETLEVLAIHLDWLRTTSPDLAAALVHHLVWHPRDGRPWMPGALLTRCMDQVSAALDARQQAYRDRPEWQRYARLDTRGPRNRFWRMGE